MHVTYTRIENDTLRHPLSMTDNQSLIALHNQFKLKFYHKSEKIEIIFLSVYFTKIDQNGGKILVCHSYRQILFIVSVS